MLLVVLDLNGVLVDSTHKARRGVKYDAKARAKFVYFRPGLHEFLAWLCNHPGIRVGIWTSNIARNADALVSLLFTEEQRARLAFVFSRDECIVFPDYSSVKPPERIFAMGFDPKHTIMVDDSPEKIDHPAKDTFYRHIPSFTAGPRATPVMDPDTDLDTLRRYIEVRVSGDE